MELAHTNQDRYQQSPGGTPVPRRGSIVSEDRPGYIYLFRCENFFKIGKSKNPERRLQDLQRSTPFEIRLIKTYPVVSMSDAERVAHHEFSRLHRGGEWFTGLIEADFDLLDELMEVWKSWPE